MDRAKDWVVSNEYGAGESGVGRMPSEMRIAKQIVRNVLEKLQLRLPYSPRSEAIYTDCEEKPNASAAIPGDLLPLVRS